MLFFRVRFVKVSSSHNRQKVTEHWTHFCTIFQTTLLIVIGVQEDIWQGFAIQNCLVWNNSIVRILENQSLFSVFIYNSEKARWISETPVNFHYWIREEQKKTLVEFFEYHKKYPEKSLPQLSAHHRHFICFIPQLELPQVPLFFFRPKNSNRNSMYSVFALYINWHVPGPLDSHISHITTKPILGPYDFGYCCRKHLFQSTKLQAFEFGIKTITTILVEKSLNLWQLLR